MVTHGCEVGLRPYQQNCLNVIEERRRANVMRQLISLFTGGGKTVIFANLPSMMPRGKQMLMLVHTLELVEQGAEKISKWNPSLNVGVEMASRHVDGREDVVVASVQTLGKDGSPRLQKFDPNNFHWVVNDECHRSVAPTYQRVNDYFMQGEDVCLTGFTATSQRGDGRAMGQVFNEIVFSYGMLEGVRDGWLVDVHGVQVKTGTDLSELTSREFDKDDVLSRAVNTPARNEVIVRNWIEHAWPRITVAFTVDIQHARDLAAAFKRQGIKADYIFGADPDRKKKLAMFKAGEIEVLTNAALLIEGFDMWEVECVILAAPSKSQGRIVQQVGRGTRLDERVDNLVEWRERGLLKEEHKETLLVVDCLDIFGRHSLVTLPSLFGLSAKLDMQGKSVTQVVAAIASAQKRNPNADLSSLESIDSLDTYIQYADLWQVKFAQETEEFTELQWSKRGDGAFMIKLPKNEFFRVTEDMLGHFQIEGRLKGLTYKREGLMSLADAVRDVEKEITSRDPDLLTLLGKEQKWRKHPVSAGQMEMLERLRVPQEFIAQMNKGSAADYITEKLNRR